MLEHCPVNEQFAWLGAMIDGEGCIGAYAFPTSIRRDGSIAYRVKLMLSVTNTSPAIIAEECWRVHITSNGPVSRVLLAVRPWLVAKGAQADLVVAIATHRQQVIKRYGRKGRASRVEDDEWLSEQLGSLRELNRKGPEKATHVSL